MPPILNILIWAGTAFGGLFLLVVFFAFLNFGALWFRALSSGAPVSMIQLIAMQFRRVDASRVINAKIMAHQAGIQSDNKSGIATQDLEAHFLAGGDIDRVTQAIIAAERANIDLDFDRAAAIDLAGRDVLDAVKTSVTLASLNVPIAPLPINLRSVQSPKMELNFGFGQELLFEPT